MTRIINNKRHMQFRFCICYTFLLAYINIPVNFQWKRSADGSKEVPANFASEALKEVPASETLRAYTFFDYFICDILVVICKLDLVFCF